MTMLNLLNILKATVGLPSSNPAYIFNLHFITENIFLPLNVQYSNINVDYVTMLKNTTKSLFCINAYKFDRYYGFQSTILYIWYV